MKAKKEWHSEAKKFLKFLNQEYNFSEDEQRVVYGTCQNLSSYWKATEKIEAEGITVLGMNGLLRKHPATEVAKVAWAGFLSGIRHLGVCAPHTDKRPVGRPGSGV